MQQRTKWRHSSSFGNVGICRIIVFFYVLFWIVLFFVLFWIVLFYVLFWIVLFYVLFLSIVLFYVLSVCKCALYYCHRVSTQLQLTNISYHIISYHIISYHIISYHIISYRIISYHISYRIVSHRIVSHHIVSYIISYIISYHIISYHIISYHIISYHIISYHIVSYIISYHIISYVIQTFYILQHFTRYFHFLWYFPQKSSEFAAPLSTMEYLMRKDWNMKSYRPTFTNYLSCWYQSAPQCMTWIVQFPPCRILLEVSLHWRVNNSSQYPRHRRILANDNLDFTMKLEI